MKKAKMFLVAIAVVGIAGGAVAFKAQKFNSLPYFGCGADRQCDNSKTAIPLSKVSTNVNDPVQNGVTTSSTQSCTTDADCGSFHYTTDL